MGMLDLPPARLKVGRQLGWVPMELHLLPD